MVDPTAERTPQIPQLPARMLWVFATLMLVDVIVFRHLEAVDPGRTLRHGCGALAVAALGIALSRGSRKAYWAALVWSGIMALVSWSGVLLIVLWHRMPFGEQASMVGLASNSLVLTAAVMSLLSPAARKAFLGARGRS